MKRVFELMAVCMLAVWSLAYVGCTKADDGDDNEQEENKGGNDKDDDDNKNDDIPFVISVSRLSATGAAVKVVPADRNKTYYFGVYDKETLVDKYDGDAEKMVQIETLNPLISAVGSNLGLWSQYLTTGETEELYYDEFRGDTDYVVVAAGVEFGVRTTDAVVYEFTTPGYGDVTNTFTVTEDHGIVRVEASTLDYFFWNACLGPSALVDPAFFEGATDEEVIQYYIDYLGGNISYVLLSYNESFYDFSSYLVEGQSYMVVVFGYDGGPTSKVTRFTFTFEGVDRTWLTTLNGPHTFDNANSLTFTRSLLDAVPGVAYWDIMIEDTRPSGECCQTAVLTDIAAETPEGEFEMPLEWIPQAGYALSGMIAEEYFIGTWWYDYDDSDTFLDGRAIADTGKVNISRNGNIYTVTVDFLDPKGNAVKCTYTGPAEITRSAAPASAAAKLAK